MDSRALLSELNRALVHENSLSIYYPTQAAVLTGLHGHQVGELLKKAGEESAGHASALRGRIAALGGVPSMEVKPLKLVKTAEAALKQALALEREAKNLYSQLLQSVSKEEHFLLYEAIEEILEDEVEGVERFERLA